MFESGRFSLAAVAAAAVLVLGTSACSEPECPPGFYKTGKLCKRVDAGVDAEAEVLEPETEAGQSPVLRGAAGEAGVVTVTDAGATDAAAPGSSDGAIDAAADAGPADSGAAVDAGDAGAEAGAVNDAGVTDASADTAVSCGAGYLLKNGTCQDIDECFEGTHQCHTTATCKNTAGSYDCECPLGYSGGTAAGFACAPRIAVGEQHACVLLSNGTVQCWGKNANGQVGDGTMTERLTPATVPDLSDVVAIDAGWGATCALLREGRLRCWGSKVASLGSSSATDQLTPAFVPLLTTVVAFDIYMDHACAVLRDQTIKCWGANADGQLGTGGASAEPALAPVGVVGIRDAAQVFVGQKQTCAILRSGAARCWGNPLLGAPTGTSSLTPVDLPVPSNVKGIAFGPFHVCSVHTDTIVYCWGPPSLLGSGTTQGDFSPRPIQGLRASAVALGVYSTVALRVNGTIAWWDAALTPAPVDGVAEVAALGSAGQQVCHLLRDGRVSCWTLSNAVPTGPVQVNGIDLW